MRVAAASSSAVRPVLDGARQCAEWLGASPSALYLLTRSGTVLAIVTHDAVRLPCSLVLSSTAAELPLDTLVPDAGRRHAQPAVVGQGGVTWSGPAGVVSVFGAREWAPHRVAVGTPRWAALDELRRAVQQCDVGVERDRLTALAQARSSSAHQHRAVAGLLGRGPGLTPSGDDVLAGYLLGTRAFGRPVPVAILASVWAMARERTTVLSAQLLEHAARGECIAELAAVTSHLVGRSAPRHAVSRLLAVGHTSGAALALGLVSAAAHEQATTAA